MNPIRKEFQYGDQLVVIETGEIARQANGAVMIDIEGTVLLVTVVGKNDAKGGDFEVKNHFYLQMFMVYFQSYMLMMIT